MHVLVTRSGEQGRQLAERLAGFGLAVIHYAPVEPGPLSETEALRRQLFEVLPVDILIAPSAEALRQIHALSDPLPLSDSLLVVPGPGTASVASRLGMHRIRYPEAEGTSERILELPEFEDVAGRRVLIAAAVGGRTVIEEELRRRGATVQRLNVYERRLIMPPAQLLETLGAGADLITLLASGGALDALRHQLTEAQWRHVASQPMIAPSLRVARLAEAAGCAEVHAATAADDHAMLAALKPLCPELSLMRYPVKIEE